MKKIYSLYTLLILAVLSVNAQTEVTPDMIWREGVTVKLLDESMNYKIFTFQTQILDGKTYLTDTPHAELDNFDEMDNDEFVSFLWDSDWLDYHEYSFKRYEEGKIYNYLLDANSIYNNRKFSGYEYMMHDISDWDDSNGLSYNFPNWWLPNWWSTNLKTVENVYQVTNLEKLYNPDGNYWMWGFNDDGDWHVKGIGPVDSYQYFTIFNLDRDEPAYSASENFNSLRLNEYKNVKKPRILEINSPEGEIYFRHPDYTPDDELGAIAAVTLNNGVNITCNAGEVCVTAAVPSDVEIFTAQGTKVYGASTVKHTTCKLQQGLYIVRAGSHVKKLILN